MDVLESPRKKFFRVQRIAAAGKKHLSRRKKCGGFKSLCGLVFGPPNLVAVGTKYMQLDICKRCVKCRTKIVRRGYFSERLIRVFASEEDERHYWLDKRLLGETPEGQGLLAHWEEKSKA